MIARFRADITALWPEGERLALAVSGGPDSLALLLLAHAVRPDAIEAATVDHRLRPQAQAEAQMVANLCQGLGVQHEVLRVQVGQGNIQSMARKARYAALSDWMKQRSIVRLATAHHCDDQAETLVMRLNRGSGLSGLAGVRKSGQVPGTQFALIRPLLGWRKAELAKLLADCGIEPAQDPSNCDEAFDRVRMRNQLAQTPWLDSEAIAQSAAHLADAEQVLVWAAQREWDDHVRIADDQIAYVPHAPRAVRLQILARAIAMLGSEPRGGAVAKLLDALEAGQNGNLAGVLVTPSDSGWTLQAEPRRSKSSSGDA